MELLIGIAVIFVLLLCLGVGVEIIIQLALCCVGLFIVFMTAVFIYSAVILLLCKKSNGRYVRWDNDENKIPYAYYNVDGIEYKNLFPREVMLRKLIYREDKDVRLYIYEKKRQCFDGNAVTCCIFGLIVSLFLLVEAVLLVLGNGLL